MTTVKPEDKIRLFVRKHLDGGRATAFTLCQQPAGGGLAVVDTYEVTEGSTAEDLAGLIYEAAAEDADGMGAGVQRYVVLAKSGEDRGTLGRHAFRMAPSEEESQQLEPSEPATLQGVTAQLMRHGEARERVSAELVAVMLHSLQKQNARLIDQNERMMAGRVEMIETYEELASRKHERDLEHKQLAAKIDREQAMMDRIAPLLPVVAAKIAGGKQLPGGPTPRDAILKGFMESITSEQLVQLGQILTVEQRVAVGSLLEQVQQMDGKPAPANGVNGKASA